MGEHAHAPFLAFRSVSVRLLKNFAQLFCSDKPIAIQVKGGKHSLNLGEIRRTQLSSSEQQRCLDEVRSFFETMQTSDGSLLLTFGHSLAFSVKSQNPGMLKCRRCRETLVGIFVQQLANQVTRLLASLGPSDARRELYRVLADRLSARVHITTIKRNQTAKELIHGRSDSPAIGWVPEGLPADDLRSHKMNSPSDLADDVSTTSIKHGRQAKVDDLCHASRTVWSGHHDVLWLHVAVHNPHAVTIRGCHQGMSDNLRHKFLFHFHVGLLHKLLAVPTPQRFQDEVQLLILAVEAVLVQANNMRVVQALERFNLQQTRGYFFRLQFSGVDCFANPNHFGGFVRNLHY
mmetsp:Transcript_43082/g.113308  ORF Transcript_43082/g.113308 Transcript_43082/m.113308 type:complete len:347 (-) Transcript_43082:230-1270(-)